MRNIVTSRRRGHVTGVLVTVAVLGAVLALAVPGAGATTGPVGRWHLDQTAGPVLIDSSGFGADGTLRGVDQGPTAGTWTSGVSGNALDFSGPYQWAVFPGQFPLHRSEGSLSFWVNVAESGHQTLFWSGEGPYGPDANRFHIYVGLVMTAPYGTPGIGVDYRSPDGSLSVLFERSIPLNTWVHVGVTKAGTDYGLYLDGVPVGTASDAVTVLPTWNTDWKIGRMDYGFGSFAFSGKLDEIGTWDRALSSSEMHALYQGQSWTLGGFYQPVDMGGVLNTVKGGATVPLKFTVYEGSTRLTDPAVVGTFTTQQVSCASVDATLADAIEVVTTGATSLRYDPVAGQFIQNWQTPRKPGTCHKVTLTTDDGSTLIALFQLK